MAGQTVSDFRASWTFTRALTRSFIEGTPDDRWDFTPHERYGSMARQFRHVVQVTDRLGELLDVFIEHEANHHGLRSAYATLGGWEAPESWRENWDL